MKKFLTILSIVILSGCSTTEDVAQQLNQNPVCDLEYSPYQATVIGYCQEEKANLPEEIPTKHLKLEIRPEAEIPDIFWYNNKFAYSVNKQEGQAPLVFVIAGTGASYYSPIMQSLQKTLFSQGYHVVSLSSPTYSNFIINASTEDNRLPGYLQRDAQILHSVMTKVVNQLTSEENVQITDYHITGYSLGGAHSAFVAQYDQEQNPVFNFKKVLLINPPASLYSSVNILDNYLDLENRRHELVDMMENIFDRLSHSYASMDSAKLSMDSIYELFGESNISDEELKTLIGTAFRLSSSDMLFSIDTTYNLGVLTHKNHTLSKFESISHAQQRANEIGFLDYFHRGMVPFYQEQEPGLTEQVMIKRLGLHSLEDYIKDNKHIALVTNADDIILADGEIDYFKDIFGERAQIFERGGHCGNMDRASFVNYMSEYFAIN